MRQIDVKAFDAGTFTEEATTYTAIVIESTDGDIFSVTLHPYQVEKLLRTLPALPEGIVADSNQCHRVDNAISDLKSRLKQDVISKTYMAQLTTSEWLEKTFAYKIIFAEGGSVLLSLEPSTADRLAKRLNLLIQDIAALRRH